MPEPLGHAGVKQVVVLDAEISPDWKAVSSETTKYQMNPRNEEEPPIVKE